LGRVGRMHTRIGLRSNGSAEDEREERERIEYISFANYHNHYYFESSPVRVGSGIPCDLSCARS